MTIQINELKARDIATVQGLAGMPLPLEWKPDRGSADSYIRIREQARIVVVKASKRKFLDRHAPKLATVPCEVLGFS